MKMTASYLAFVREKFHLSQQEVSDIKHPENLIIWTSPCYDDTEPDNEIHLHHQLIEHFNRKNEHIVKQIVEVIRYSMEEDCFKVIGKTMRYEEPIKKVI